MEVVVQVDALVDQGIVVVEPIAPPSKLLKFNTFVKTSEQVENKGFVLPFQLPRGRVYNIMQVLAWAYHCRSVSSSLPVPFKFSQTSKVLIRLVVVLPNRKIYVPYNSAVTGASFGDKFHIWIGPDGLPIRSELESELINMRMDILRRQKLKSKMVKGKLELGWLAKLEDYPLIVPDPDPVRIANFVKTPLPDRDSVNYAFKKALRSAL
ncbi:unnamed protein product [Calypogeia fissa]